MVVNQQLSHWEYKKLGDVAIIKTGGSAPQGDRFFKEGTNPFVRVQHFDGSKEYVDKWDLITNEAVKVNRLKIFPVDTILFPKSGASIHLEKRAKLPIPSYVVSHLCCLISKDIDNNFLFYWLKLVHLSNTSNGSTLPYLNVNEVAKITVPVPPLSEQRRIAAILTAVQRAIEQQERLIALTTEMKKALMQKLFNEGTRGEPQKMTEVGPVPESWELYHIKDLFEIQLGKMLSKKAKSGILSKPYLRNKNVQWGKIDVSDLYEMDFNEKEQRKFRLNYGDLLVCEGGEPGRAAIWYSHIEECYYQKALHRLRPKTKKITNQFLLYWLWYSIGIQKVQGISGASSTIAHLPATQLKRLYIPIPSIEEQKTICEILNNVEEIENLKHKKQNKLQDLFRTLIHQLMTAKIRVNEVDLSELKAIGIDVD